MAKKSSFFKKLVVRTKTKNLILFMKTVFYFIPVVN